MYNIFMSRIGLLIELSPDEQSILESWSRSGKTEQRLAFRSKIILAANEGKENKYIAGDLSTTVSTVGKWRHRFLESRMNGLSDASRSGVTPKYNDAVLEKRTLETLDKPVPYGYAT